ncbi:MAG: UPF0236 family protein [Clostridiales Family XIII bacterium]|nr:UPF0236 family protein [Clostridiales Family XIII bacterium]
MLLPKSKDDGKLLNELEGKRGIFPLDIALGIDKLPHNMTVKAMLKVSKCAQAASSYKNASKTLADDHGIKLDPATIMTVTNHIGGLVFKNEMANAEECYNSLVTGKMTFPQRKKDAVLYIEMDGAFVNTREKSETANSTWHENKLGLVFSSESKHPIQSRAKKDSNLNTQNIYERKKYKLMQKNYTAYVGSVDEFKKLMFYCAVRSGYGSYKETVLISDGATWIRNLKEFLFWDAQQILDYYHLSEKVWAFGRQYFKITTSNNNYKKYNDLEKEIINHPNYSEYKVWGDKICDKILNSRIDEVFTDISNKEQHLNAKNGKLSKYILNNKESIDYALYIKKGYDIGSGAIESANKNVLQKRLDGPGMRWYIESAQNLVTLRAKMESDRWYDDVVTVVNKFYNIN